MAIQPIKNERGDVIDEYDDGKQEENPPREQEDSTLSPLPKTLEPETSTQAGAPKEDLTEFDLNDISIQIMLHKADDHPQGRLVSVIIHDFSGTPVIGTFREAELTEKSRLDSIHRAIYPLMQRFLLDLASRSQKKLQEAAPKTVASPTSIQSRASTKTSATTPTSTSEASSPSPSPTQTKTVSKENNKKKGKQDTKYQAIPMF